MGGAQYFNLHMIIAKKNLVQLQYLHLVSHVRIWFKGGK